jgi:hypothetical protein
MLCVEPVDPVALAEPASRLLAQVWEPPCLHYTPDYLRWQFGFTGEHLSSIGLAVYRDFQELIGFNSATVRRLRFRGTVSDVFLVCLSAVHPAWHGSRVAGILWKAMLEAVLKMERPYLSFAEAGSPTDRSAQRAQPGRYLTSLGSFPIHGFMPRPNAEPGDIRVIETEDPEAMRPVIRACDDEATLWNDPDPRMLAHYAADPRPSAMLLLEGPEGDLRGAARIVCAETLTSQGQSILPIVENLFLPNPDADTLRALCLYAARRWPDRVTAPMVSIPNVWGIDPDILKAAGLRQTTARFVGFIGTYSVSDPFTPASGTNLDIV